MKHHNVTFPVPTMPPRVLRGSTLFALLMVVCAGASGCRVTPSVAAEREVEGRVVLIRGLMDVFSLGMNELAGRLAEHGFEATAISGAVRAEEGRRLIESSQAGELPRPLVIAGHSYGGDSAVRLTRQLDRANVTVDKLILIDATTPPPVPGNVRKVFNIYRSSPGTDWVPALRGVPINERRRESDLPETHVVNFDLRKADDPKLSSAGINHFTIDASRAVQDLVVEQVLALRSEQAHETAATRGGDGTSGTSRLRLLEP